MGAFDVETSAGADGPGALLSAEHAKNNEQEFEQMEIIYFDGRKELAREIEFCNDRPALIVNGWHVVPLAEIVRIVKA